MREASETAGRALPPVPLRGVWHQIRADETLAGLARLYRVPSEDIEEINGLRRRDPLPIGAKIFVPGAQDPHTPQASPPSTQETSAVAAGGANGAFAEYVWPVPGGKVISAYGLRGKRPHEGTDIGAPEGTAVLAAAAGMVIYAGSGVRGYGSLILLRHDNGMVTVYAHNRKNLVGEKTRVRQGQVIAEVGHTGNATTSHLHFEIRRGEKPEDPTRYVHPD
jgi:murein DD-endopeptidase MepM/ murein hydrolase activator NlpD